MGIRLPIEWPWTLQGIRAPDVHLRIHDHHDAP
jgi:hypothetical protein